MPDLGKYAVEVLSAYAGGLALLALIGGQSLLRARRVARQLRQAEGRRDG
ncbi:MAG: heme exporter protein CcmD [Tranquillimonas sp.]|jgi:heme exporter protein D